ncbi:F0F1 ATP synthase subunit A [Eubacterium uniforme]|uniref:ATP synthase subunit a n=1 Tax=Eubacterium uniforme TaxID=39495 RepID=A0A1T4VRF7_9FIRM|nr:F0F1 ATP synthase subunit A [Eubacterium uniforme]SKA67527.1 ATP synthase F0 subcomplex A subunit [Eubacterium uniforme]HAV89836.1 ATP synthase F0 subunit A [Eubacterium sp.]
MIKPIVAEADFMINGFYKFKLFGQELYITTTHISLLLISIVFLIFVFAAKKVLLAAQADTAPKGFQNFVELIVEFIDNMVQGIMGENGARFRNYIGALFMFLILSNLSGLFGLRPPTADYGVTLPLGLITFGIIHYNGIKKNKVKHFTSLFEPFALLFPINLIGEVAVPLSLSLRLFGNILSGTVMMGLIYGMLPLLVKLGMPAALHVYFDIFSGCIQTYVFCMLTMVYVNDKISD